MPDVPNSETTPSWGGLDIATIRSLRLQLCRLKNRRLHFGGADAEILRGAPVTAVGKMVGFALESLRTSLGRSNVPLNQHLAAVVGVDAPRFSQFVNGQKSDPRPWVEVGQKTLWYLMTGKLPVGETLGVRTDVANLAEKINEYFFRDPEEHEWPKYFHADRARSVQAWTYTELAMEVDWLCDYAVSHQENCEMWYVSGGDDVLQGFNRPDHSMRLALVECLRSPVIDLHLVVADDALRGASVIRSIDGLTQSVPNLQAKVIRLNKSPGSPSSFLNPELRFLYWRLRSEQSLWIMRLKPEGSETEPFPTVLLANSHEKREFLSWIGQVKEYQRQQQLRIAQRPLDPSKEHPGPPHSGKKSRRKKEA